MLIGNGLTFLFVVAAVLIVDVPVVRHKGEEGWRQLTIGIRLAVSRPALLRLLLTMFFFSFLCLPFVGLFPTVAEMGFDDRTIADALGQSTEAMARHYSKRANRRQKMAKVVLSFDAELNKRGTKTVNLSSKKCQTPE